MTMTVFLIGISDLLSWTQSRKIGLFGPKLVEQILIGIYDLSNCGIGNYHQVSIGIVNQSGVRVRFDDDTRGVIVEKDCGSNCQCGFIY
jgi:hypothetical protein